ncbi:MAG: type II secretion system F family protein [Sphingomonas sp.]
MSGPALILLLCLAGMAGLLVMALRGPSADKAQNRRLLALRERHSETKVVEAQMRRILASRETKLDTMAGRILPNPALLAKKIERTGKSWTLGNYALLGAGLAFAIAAAAWVRGAPLLLSLFGGIMIGLFIPNFLINRFIGKRLDAFTAKFPDAIELLVRGLRSGLPISETLGVVGQEVPGPVGVEFRLITDRIKIGRTMEAALQETSDRLGTPEFQFFVITLAIQRETGGNLAETLSNLSDVLRKRAQMKLKIKAMSSESKASAYIIGVLPFAVFAMILYVNSDYMGKFFSDPRLIVTGLGGLVWMGIGAFIMKQMINFEI